MPRSNIHPELSRAARFLPRISVGPRALKAIRPLERLAARRPTPPGSSAHRVGSAAVRLHRPEGHSARPAPAVLWIHGGGYVVGLAAQDDRLCRELARRVGAVVAAVDYRRAPEHPYPAALQDCHQALVWLASQPEVDPERIAIAGSSAGGGLAAALALMARERGQVTPAFQLLAYPMLDDRTAVRTDIDETGFRLWTNRSNRYGWQSYLGAPPGSAGVVGTAAPARADDLSGLPPAWIGVGTLDLFIEEDLEYARRLEEAGVPCEVCEVQGAFHGFDSVVPKAGISRKFRAAQVDALAAALKPS